MPKHQATLRVDEKKRVREIPALEVSGNMAVLVL